MDKLDKSDGLRLQRVSGSREIISKRRKVIAIVLPVLAVVFLVTTGLLAYGVYGNSAASGQRTAVLVAARQEAIALTTLSKTTGAKDFDAVLAGSAGELKQQLSAGRGSFLKTLKTANVSSVGTVLDAGVVSLTPGSSATALLNVRATVTNSQTGKPETRLYHWRANLVDSDGQWLVTKLEFV